MESNQSKNARTARADITNQIKANLVMLTGAGDRAYDAQRGERRSYGANLETESRMVHCVDIFPESPRGEPRSQKIVTEKVKNKESARGKFS